MFRKIIDSIRNVFASPEKKLEMKTRALAMQTTRKFDTLQKNIKDNEYAMADHQRAVNDREQFLRDNEDLHVDQNVSRNTDNKRAKYILWVVVSIASVLSVKGLRFFLGEFYATVNMWLVLPLAFFLAYFIVHGSIYINNFSNQYKEKNAFIYYQIKVFAYGMVLFIPAMNLLEGFNSNYRPVVMALNIVGCVIDVVLHSSLVSMSSVFKTAENSEKAIKIMRLKDKSLTSTEQILRVLNDTFMKVKAIFTSSAKELVNNFTELRIVDPQAAANTLLLLDNFTIWMINNKVMMHEIIPYHVGPDGQPVISRIFFNPEQDSIRSGWDILSTVRVDNTNNQQIETLNRQRQVNELPAGNDAIQQPQQNPVEDASAHEPVPEQPQTNPADYDAMVENVNSNDKTL